MGGVESEVWRAEICRRERKTSRFPRRRRRSCYRSVTGFIDCRIGHLGQLLPNPDAIKRVALSAKKWVKMENAMDYHKMTWEEKRALVEQVFGGTTPDGGRMGVYIERLPAKGKRFNWRYSIRGQIVEEKLIPKSIASFERFDRFDPARDLCEQDLAVSQSSLSTPIA